MHRYFLPMTHLCDECQAAVSDDAAAKYVLKGKFFWVENDELKSKETNDRVYFCSEKCQMEWGRGLKRFTYAKAKDKVPEERGIS